jgi:hypothetical protein
MVETHTLEYGLVRTIIQKEEEEEELRIQGYGVNEVSFRSRPHHNVHRTQSSTFIHQSINCLLSSIVSSIIGCLHTMDTTFGKCFMY